jgi:hypothetical protein
VRPSRQQLGGKGLRLVEVLEVLEAEDEVEVRVGLVVAKVSRDLLGAR